MKGLAATKERLDGLERHLIEKYQSFSTEHCGELIKRKEYQPHQERSYRDHFRLAKERDDRIRLAAQVKTELDTW